MALGAHAKQSKSKKFVSALIDSWGRATGASSPRWGRFLWWVSLRPSPCRSK